MKSVLYAVSVFLMLSAASTTTLAYSGSECEVNDCSTPGPEKSKTKATKNQVKSKTDVKAEAKEGAKNQSEAKLLDKAPASLKDVTGFLK